MTQPTRRQIYSATMRRVKEMEQMGLLAFSISALLEVEMAPEEETEYLPAEELRR